MRRMLLLCAVAVMCLKFASAQSPPKPAVTIKGDSDSSLKWGLVADGKFASERLGLSYQIPTDFIVASTAETELLTAAGSDMAKQGNAQEKKIDEAVGNAIRLFLITERPIGSPENSALEMVAAKQPSGVTANMSLASNVSILKGTTFSLKRFLGSLKIGSNTFAAAELEVSVNGLKFSQRMYVIMHRGYSIVCVATYYTDAQRIQLERSLATLTLRK